MPHISASLVWGFPFAMEMQDIRWELKDKFFSFLPLGRTV